MANSYRSEPEWVPIDDPVETLTDDLMAVCEGGVVRIWSGEANPTVYNHDRVRSALRYALDDQKAKVQIILGPLVVVDDSGRNALLDLAEEGVAIYHRLSRGATAHFRVVETDDGYRYYTEFPHPPLLPKDQRLRANLDVMSSEAAAAEVETAVDVFDSWIEDLSDRDRDPDMPWFTTSEDLAKLVAITEKQNQSFDHLSIADLLDLPGAEGLLTKRDARD